MVKDRQSRFTSQAVNKVSGRKSTSRAASPEERIQKWKNHFKNLLGNSLGVTDIPEKKFQAEKLQALTKYFLKYGKQENLMTCFFDYVILSINKTL